MPHTTPYVSIPPHTYQPFACQSHWYSQHYTPPILWSEFATWAPKMDRIGHSCRDRWVRTLVLRKSFSDAISIKSSLRVLANTYEFWGVHKMDFLANG